MATSGHFVRERIPVPRSASETGRLVIDLVSDSRDTTAESDGPMTFRLVRRYRPTWATVTGFLIFPLFVRNSETCRLAVIDAAAGSEVLLEGTIDSELHDRLIQLARSSDSSRVSTLGPRPVPSVLASQPHAAAAQNGTPPSAPPAAPPRDRSIDLRGREAGWGDERSSTLLPREGLDASRPAGGPAFAAPPADAAPANGSHPGSAPSDWSSYAPPPASALSPPAAYPDAGRPAPAAAPIHLSLDSGESAELRDLLIIGRAPSRGAGETHADLLTVNDPSLSVSKSHLTVELDQDGLWVTDRGSTNGSWMDDGRGALRPVPPRQRTHVPPGARVLIGERVITFTRR